MRDRVVRWLTVACAGASLLSSLLLVVQDVAPVLTGSVRHAWLAAWALLLAGIACLGLASAARARKKDLFMRLSLGSAFILWGIQQLLNRGALSVTLGDIVIVLFIVDLGAIIDTSWRTHQLARRLKGSDDVDGSDLAFEVSGSREEQRQKHKPKTN
jgi:hypothetical protein